MILIICLSIALSLSSSQTIIEDMFEDDGELSFDRDFGWRFYSNDDRLSTFDRCNDQSPSATCQVEDTTNDITYYGPYQNGYFFLERNFACNDSSTVTIDYEYVYCDQASFTNKDFVRATLESSLPNSVIVQGAKIRLSAITTTSTAYTTSTAELGQSAPATCLSWKKHTQSDSLFDNAAFIAYADEPFTVAIKGKFDSSGDVGYVFNVEVTCTQDSSIGAPPAPGPLPGNDHNEYCIQGLPTSTNYNPNGEYILRLDVNGNEVDVHDELSFDKNDKNGRAYLYKISEDTHSTLLTNTGEEQWIISKDPEWVNQGDSSHVIAKCPVGTGSTAMHPASIHSQCTSFTDANDNALSGIIIKAGDEGCKEHTIIGSLFGLFPTDGDEIKVLTLLISLSVLSCIVGMMTCYCCQLIFGYKNKTKNYKKVSDKDVDVDF